MNYSVRDELQKYAANISEGKICSGTSSCWGGGGGVISFYSYCYWVIFI